MMCVHTHVQVCVQHPISYDILLIMCIQSRHLEPQQDTGPACPHSVGRSPAHLQRSRTTAPTSPWPSGCLSPPSQPPHTFELLASSHVRTGGLGKNLGRASQEAGENPLAS